MNTPKHGATSRIHIIGLAGPAYSGKDTSAGLLAEMARPYMDVTIRAFAHPIREMLGVFVPQSYMHDPAKKEADVPGIGASYRELAQTLGTEWGRRHFGDIWVRIMHRIVFDPAGTFHTGGRHHLVLIPDVRFINESRWIHEQGGHVIRIQRPQSTPTRSHASEREWQDIAADSEINNDGTLGELRQKLVGALLRFSIVQQVQAEQARAA